MDPGLGRDDEKSVFAIDIGALKAEKESGAGGGAGDASLVQPGIHIATRDTQRHPFEQG